jgi:Ran GTPase-activating protein (RanGAP) involved in mRNA processing and transport
LGPAGSATSTNDSGAEALAETLKVNASLQELNLCKNFIGDYGAEAIAEALKVNASLLVLDLSSTQIGNSGAVAIARALSQHSTQQMLDLRENNILDAGVAALEQSLERSFLGLDQNLNARFPEVFHELLTRKHHFLYALSEKGFRSFIMNDVPPALWPHALARVSTYPLLIFRLLLQIPWRSNFA